MIIYGELASYYSYIDQKHDYQVSVCYHNHIHVHMHAMRQCSSGADVR